MMVPFLDQKDDEKVECIPFGSYFLKNTTEHPHPLRLNLNYASGAIYNMCGIRELETQSELSKLFTGKYEDAESLLVQGQSEGEFDFVIRHAHPVTLHDL